MVTLPDPAIDVLDDMAKALREVLRINAILLAEHDIEVFTDDLHQQVWYRELDCMARANTLRDLHEQAAKEAQQ